MKKKPRGPEKKVRTPERVRQALVRSPARSARRHAAELNISRESVRRNLQRDLRFHPYTITVVQELKARDYVQREDFAVRIQVVFEEEENLILMSDEAHFHLNGTVNKQNCRYWSPDNPHNIHQRPLHSDRVKVWCAVAPCGIIGPYFFEENGVTETVNSARYIEMITNFLRPELRRRRINCANVWFQQDGATAHTANELMTIARNMFPGHLISRFGDVPWPPRSPDLSTCDFFFLWGYLKWRVYAHKTRTLNDLKEVIRQEIRPIGRQLLARVMDDFKKKSWKLHPRRWSSYRYHF